MKNFINRAFMAKKKIFAFFAALCVTVCMSAANYGILVNGKIYFAGSLVDEFEGFTQYLAHVKVAKGDYCQLYDADNKAAWAVELNTYSVSVVAGYEAASKIHNFAYMSFNTMGTALSSFAAQKIFCSVSWRWLWISPENLSRTISTTALWPLRNKSNFLYPSCFCGRGIVLTH